MNAFYNIKQNSGIVLPLPNNDSPKFNLLQIIEDLLDSNSPIAAEDIEQALFPMFQHAIFISHFSVERGKILKVKEYIEGETQCMCFVDSLVWSSVYDALNLLMKKSAQRREVYYIDESKKGYVYVAKDYANLSKHLFLILAHALQEVVMNSSAFIFISDAPKNKMADIKGGLHVASPWVALELLASKNIDAIPIEKRASLNESVDEQIMYPACIKHLTPGEVDEFIENFLNVYPL